MDLDDIVAKVRHVLEHEPGIVVAWIFGSVARGTARPESDVDVAVAFDDVLPLPRLLDLQAALTELLQKETQVVDVRRAPVDLVHRVLRDGILVVERDRSKRIRLEVDARNRYFDMRPILLEYRRGARPA